MKITYRQASRVFKRSALALVLMGGLASTPVLAAKRALLVGVSEYPNLPASLQLDGPVHDAEIVHGVLLQRGFDEENIEQLVTGIEEQALPTRANIIAALEGLAASAQDEDFIYLHFAGHGSRQPARASDNIETNGLDEIFLPMDADKWNSSIGSVENAIIDDEIGAYIDRIRDRGADVWLVFDSCHSGTMTRGAVAMPEVKYRRVGSDLLGIPDSLEGSAEANPILEIATRGYEQSSTQQTSSKQPASQQTSSQPQGEPVPAAERGELIAFSAAQSAETTPEMKLPRNSDGRRFHGLFTYTMMEVLGANPKLTYQQLAQQVVSRYQSLPWQATQPLFSASDMNRPVFNEEQSVAQVYPANLRRGRLEIQAGALTLLDAGAKVEVLSSPMAAEDERLGTLLLEEATPLKSWASVPEEESVGWPESVYVRLIEPVANTEVGVALLPARSMNEERQQQVEDWLAQLASQGVGIAHSALDSADILVSEFDGHLWFMRADQSLPCEEQSLSEPELATCTETRLPQKLLNMPLTGDEEQQQMLLAASLQKIATVTRLMASMQHLPGGQQISSSFRIERNGTTEDFPVNAKPVLNEGDRILFDLTNRATRPQDVSILFVDSQYGVYQLYPDSGQPNRLGSGESLSFQWDVNVDTVGTEHLLVSSVPGVGVNTDLGYLQQAPLNVSTRGLGIQLSKPAPSSEINLFSWQVSP
ncbi:caspase family protein [Marinobacterium lutimaris]|uniref:Caspase domain-containing protein n=1 Tax=Marinobacterium lutimaris TaxID=568106 RepID=A0A1H5YR69_9GAMM|nr:caspase family protein [Marinobacterium lutimaris]SEG26300.1 Caspase domain-containing protein [Marinobacterium lutimaris]